MSKLTRYIFGQIFVVTLVATISLCLLVTMVQSVKFIDLIVNNGLPIDDFGKISLLAAPRYLVFLLPVVLFGATLFTYNRLISESEIVIMRAAGLSQGRLARAGLTAALLGVLIGYGLTLYLVPVSQHDLRTLILQARSQWGAALLREGKFTTIGNDITIFISERGTDNSLQGIFYSNSKEKSTIIAEKGAFIETEDGPKLIVLNGNKQVEKNGELHVVTFERSTVDIATQKKKTSRWIEPQERFITELFNPNADSNDDQFYRQKLIAEGHNRLVSPFLSLALPIIAMAVILKGGYSRRGNIKQILFAILMMVGIYVAHLWLFSAIASNLKIVPIFYANTMVPIILGLFVILKPKYLRRKKRQQLPALTQGAS